MQNLIEKGTECINFQFRSIFGDLFECRCSFVANRKDPLSNSLREYAVLIYINNVYKKVRFFLASSYSQLQCYCQQLFLNY